MARDGGLGAASATPRPHQPRKKYGRRRPAQMEPHMVGSIGRNPRWPKPRARPTDAEMGAHDAGRARWGKHPGKSKFTLANASPVKFQHPVRFLVWSFFVAGNLVCDARRVGFCTHPTGRGIPWCAPPHLHAPPPNQSKTHRNHHCAPNPVTESTKSMMGPTFDLGMRRCVYHRGRSPLCEDFAFRGRNLTGESAPGIA